MTQSALMRLPLSLVTFDVRCDEKIRLHILIKIQKPPATIEKAHIP
jgi:hypothetical protein